MCSRIFCVISMDNHCSFDWNVIPLINDLWANGGRLVVYTDGGRRPDEDLSAFAWILYAIAPDGTWLHCVYSAVLSPRPSAGRGSATRSSGPTKLLKAVGERVGNHCFTSEQTRLHNQICNLCIYIYIYMLSLYCVCIRAYSLCIN